MTSALENVPVTCSVGETWTKPVKAALGLILLSLAAVDPARAIIGGVEVNVTEQRQRGLVTVGGGCSGILLSSDWVMTAGHCVPGDRPNPATTVRAAWAPGAVFSSDAIYQFAVANQATNPGPEFALIHLSAPVTGIDRAYRMQLYSGSSASLVGKTVAKYGIGFSTLADRNPATGPATGPGGAGIYRAADLVVTSAPDFRLMYDPNRVSQITMPGDSGGPAIVWDRGTAFLVGITSTGAFDCFDKTGATAADINANCRNSAYRVNRGFDTSIPKVKAAVEAVLKTSWNPRATSQPVLVYQPEIDLTDFSIHDVNAVHWAQAARLAAKLCYNRGFSAGHFDGHQNLSSPTAANHTFGIQCSGTGTVWRDASAVEINGTDWKFSDINSVSWARANRAAERICAKDPGFAGGHFNGHFKPGEGLFPAEYGLFCYKSPAQWFDAQDDKIAATGWGFPTYSLDDNNWAQAARAATAFCRSQKFSGGFMNGHQIPGRYGVVCQK